MKRLVIVTALLLALCGCAEVRSAAMSSKEAIREMTTEITQPKAGKVVFFGDSITCDGNFDELFPNLRVVNLGVYGDTLDDLLRRVPEVRAEDPAKIFLLGGINSLSPDNVEECLAAYAELLDALRAACPKSELIVQSVLPVGDEFDWEGKTNDAVRRFDEGLKTLAAQKGCAFADLYAVYEKDGALDPALTRDGVHLNFNAYLPWAELVAPYLK